MKTTVIYHSADFDGIFCREIARHFLGNEDVEYIGWNFGDPKVPMPAEGTVYIMDLPPDCLAAPDDIDHPGFKNTEVVWQRIVWIDHHKTTIERVRLDVPGYRIDGVAACRLAWQWFSRKGDVGPNGGCFPMKEHYINRNVIEPLSVQLVGEYDVWDKRNPWAETFQYALRAEKVVWDTLLRPPEDPSSDAYVLELLDKGDACQKYAQNVDASICNSMTWLMDWEGLKWLCVNHARFNSNFFAVKDVSETGHDALLGFKSNGKLWTVSLYHAKHRTDLDLSAIAVKHGGGGHKGACGFTCKELPFKLGC